MKPKYIFSSVIAISIMLVGLLPHLGHSLINPIVQVDQQSSTLPIVTVLPTTPSPTQSQDASNNSMPQDGITPSAAPIDPTSQASVDTSAEGYPELNEFVASVRNNLQDSVTGVFVPGVFAMPVTGQPGSDDNFVSSEDNILTQYMKPADYGVVAMLAHNYLNSGKLIAQLHPDQEIYIVYGDGKVYRYRVASVQFYQALSPNDIYSDFRDLNGPTGKILSSDQLFNLIYTHSNQLVFQTCLEANGDLSWGRIFITAIPA